MEEMLPYMSVVPVSFIISNLPVMIINLIIYRLLFFLAQFVHYVHFLLSFSFVIAPSAFYVYL